MTDYLDLFFRIFPWVMTFVALAGWGFALSGWKRSNDLVKRVIASKGEALKGWGETLDLLAKIRGLEK